MSKYIISLDQGTTSSRAVIFDKQQNIVAMSQKEFTQHYPHPGWVEHDPMEIYASQYGVLMEVVAKSAISLDDIAAIGITNQRETTIVWNKHTGKPVYNAIVWQCRRTASICENIKSNNLLSDYIKENTGLMVDAYFSATKVMWILEHVEGARESAEKGDLLFGTVDSWLIWKLTNGKIHTTDCTNASRTMFYNIRTLRWDENICKHLDIPLKMLPKVSDSSGIYGYLNIQGREIPIAGCAGDQQAALFGQKCFERGYAKNTYGTGCFLLMNTGEEMVRSTHGLISTIAIGLNGRVHYALEGSVFVGGAIIQWIRDEMRLVTDAKDTEYFAQKVEDNGGVYVVPAFTGLGAPHWDMYARGAIFGLTRGSGRNHIIRAALESIAYQTHDIIKAMVKDTNTELAELRVDGGASENNFLMQFQSDITNHVIRRPSVIETTALGAAYLAGLAVGMWKDTDEIKAQEVSDTVYRPEIDDETRKKLLHGWSKAVARSKAWEDETD